MKSFVLVLVLLALLVACKAPAEQPTELLCAASTFPNPCPAAREQVCGWYNENIQCFAYPCAQNFENACEACKSENVESWTAGECPKAGSAP